MSEVTDFWGQNRANALNVAARGNPPYAVELQQAFAFFEQRARSFKTSEGGSYYDVLHDAMKGNLNPDTTETVQYAVHLPAPYQPVSLDGFANHPAVSPTVRKMLTQEPREMVAEKVRAALQEACEEYWMHCNALLRTPSNAKTVVLFDPEQQVDEQAAGFDVERYWRIPTAPRYVRGMSTAACGFPEPHSLPALRDALGGINPYRKTASFGAYVGQCLSYPSRFEIGNTFGIGLIPYGRHSSQEERNAGAVNFNLIEDRLIPDLRLLHEDPEHNAGVTPVRTRILAGFDLTGQYDKAASGAQGYRNQALLESPDCIVYPGKGVEEVRAMVQKMLG